MTMDILQEINAKLTEIKQHPSFKAGDEITVYYKVKEGKKFKQQHTLYHTQNPLPIINPYPSKYIFLSHYINLCIL